MKNVKKFLRESNAIENVWDEQSLTQAKKAWDYLIKKSELTISDILQTHAILMKGKLDPKQTGALRTEPVYIGGHEAKPWYVIPELMAQWLQNSNYLTGTQYPGDDKEKLIKDSHIAFEAIHPFIDGNGRMGRILLNWQRVKVGLDILVVLEKEKWSYYKWFI